MIEVNGIQTQFLTEEQLGSISNTYASDKVIARAEPVIARSVIDKLMAMSKGGVVTVYDILQFRDSINA